MTKLDANKNWIEYEDLKKMAEEARKASGEPEEEPPKMVKVETPSGEKMEQETPNKWVLKVAENLIKGHVERNTPEELVFGPGIEYIIALLHVYS